MNAANPSQIREILENRFGAIKKSNKTSQKLIESNNILLNKKP